MNPTSSRTARRLVWSAFVLLFVLHQDFWLWDDRTLVFGYLPVGLLYHVLYSIAAALLWVAAIRWAWPTHIESWAEGRDAFSSGSPENGAPASSESPGA
jgi:hypothetical protein